jgi:hypothetical protein
VDEDERFSEWRIYCWNTGISAGLVDCSGFQVWIAGQDCRFVDCRFVDCRLGLQVGIAGWDRRSLNCSGLQWISMGDSILWIAVDFNGLYWVALRWI